MKAEISEALDEIRATFPSSVVDTSMNDDGSVWVVVQNVFIGDQWVPSLSSVSFTIGFQYPYADCYPHFVDPSLKRKDGAPHGDAIHMGHQTPRGDEAIMVSRQNRRAGDVPDTAATKLLKVVEWMRSK